MPQPCSKKDTLFLARQEAADAYAQAVADLANRIGVVSAAEYRGLRLAAEITRKQAEKAHSELEQHISEHGCDDVIRLLSVDTVKTYVRRVFAKLGVNNRTQAAMHAAERSLAPRNGALQPRLYAAHGSQASNRPQVPG